MRSQRHRHSQGLTLIELLVVIIILSGLMAMSASAYLAFGRRTSVYVSTYEFLNTCYQAKAMALAHETFTSIIFNDTDNEKVLADWGSISASDVTMMDSPYRSLNENGTDHWYALMNPTDRDPDDFDLEWEYGNVYTPTAKHIYKHDAPEGMRYDPLGLQIGKRHYLQNGVRFGNADDDFVKSAGPLVMPALQFAQCAYLSPNSFMNHRTSWNGNGNGAKSYMIKWGPQDGVGVLGNEGGNTKPVDNMTYQYDNYSGLWDEIMVVYFVDQTDPTHRMAVVIKSYGAVITVERQAREEW